MGAKADAALLYGAYGYAGLPYAGYSAYGAYPYAYGAYPYAYGAYYGRDPLMPSQRPMPTTDTTDMPDLTPTDMPHMLMELTHTVMDMPGESKLFQPKVLSYCKPKAQ